MSSLAEEIVDASNEISVVHPGPRAAHAKGTLMSGTFRPNGNASSLTTAAHLQNEPVRVTARLSNGGGDPGIPDYAREGRGMAVKFYLPDGAKTDIVSLTLPCFFVRTPEDFLSFTKARKDPEQLMPDWLGAHPEALAAIQAALAPTRRPATPPAPTTRSTPTAGSAPTAVRGSCATGSSRRRARRRSRPRTPRPAGATICSRSCSLAGRARSA